MKSKRSDSLMWLIVSLLSAALCAAVRLWQLRIGFEGSLRLPIPHSPSTIALICCYILVAAVFTLLAMKQKGEPVVKETPELALYAKDDTLFLGLVICSAFLTLIAAPLLLKDGYQMWQIFQSVKVGGEKIPGVNNGVLVIATAITSALSFIALLVAGKVAFRHTTKGRLSVLFPVINNCLWLMEIYRNNAADPTLWDYAPLLLAIVSGILLYLNWAGLYAGVCIPRRTLWAAGMTITLSATALAGGTWSLSSALLLTAQILSAFALLWRIPDNLRYPPELPAEEPPVEDTSAEEIPAEEKLEEETHE